ncbi:lipoate--protein ligase family protein [Candidatus Woesearchaeota archaeon]|nr:lipoate--protein ligase family protein [Candidatus Woesearchaeota archaeon]
MKWRLIIDRPRDAFTNMAIDFALLKLNKRPTVRFYEWLPAAVSIGYFQSLKEEVDIKKCDELGIDYVRRITGGGAVFHDKELTYSITIAEKNDFISRDINKSYETICSAIIAGLENIDISAEYVPLNDLVVNGKKISGCAQTRKQKKLLQHGTLLIETDVSKMFSVLKVPNEKIKGKLIKNVKERVTSLKKELEREVSFEELCKALQQGFEDYFDIEFEFDEITKEEFYLAEKLKQEKFLKKEWNFKR